MLLLYFTGKRFDKDSESKSSITKENIQKMIFNIDIIAILFTEEKDSNKLGRPADGKTKSTLKYKLQELECKCKAQQSSFPTVNPAVKSIILDLDIVEDKL